MTDAQGRYSIRLPGGQYHLRCLAPRGYLRGVHTPAPGMPTVTVQEGEEAEAPVLTARRVVAITIRVTTPGGEPAANAHVAAVGNIPFFRSSETNSSGTLKVYNQRPGVTVRFTAQNEGGGLRSEGEITPKWGEDNELLLTLAEARAPVPHKSSVSQQRRTTAGTADER